MARPTMGYMMAAAMAASLPAAPAYAQSPDRNSLEHLLPAALYPATTNPPAQPEKPPYLQPGYQPPQEQPNYQPAYGKPPGNRSNDGAGYILTALGAVGVLLPIVSVAAADECPEGFRETDSSHCHKRITARGWTVITLGAVSLGVGIYLLND